LNGVQEAAVDPDEQRRRLGSGFTRAMLTICERSIGVSENLDATDVMPVIRASYGCRLLALLVPVVVDELDAAPIQ
jgi:hypothetical protein